MRKQILFFTVCVLIGAFSATFVPFDIGQYEIGYELSQEKFDADKGEDDEIEDFELRIKSILHQDVNDKVLLSLELKKHFQYQFSIKTGIQRILVPPPKI